MGWVWTIPKENPQTHSKLIPLFPKKIKQKKWKHMSLDRIWSQFGESPNSLQTHSSCPKKANNKKWKHMSLEWVWRVWRISKLTPSSQRNLCLMSFKKEKDFFKKDETMSLENLRTLSKLKKICAHNLFFKTNACSHSKKVVHAYFFWVWREFGDSPNLCFSSFF